MSGPRILLTNDDGIHAPGLDVLRKIAAELSDDIWVVAPKGNQSGAGHRFTLGRELTLEQLDVREFAIDGTPADCVVTGATYVMGDRGPDVVLSGVNHGQNLGDIIHCSGTLAGAREGALHGAVGIALSQGVDYNFQQPVDWSAAEVHGAGLVRELIARADSADVYYNLNFPYCGAADVTGIDVVPQQRFRQAAFRYYASDNAGKFFVTIPETPDPVEPGKDFHTLLETGAITVTPLMLDQTDATEVSRLVGRFKLTP